MSKIRAAAKISFVNPWAMQLEDADMMPKRSWLLFLVLLLPAMADAAEITKAVTKRGEALRVIQIEGDIVPGDYVKFVRVFMEHGHESPSVYFYSKGGDLAEAMKIGRLIRALKLTTMGPNRYVNFSSIKDPSNNVCASSCFFMFVAGAQRFGDGRIGIHRPFLSKGDYAALSMEEAGQSSAKVRSVIGAYLHEMEVPSEYLDRMMTIPGDDVEWLGEEELRRNFNGYSPGLAEWFSARCPSPSARETEAFLRILRNVPSKSAKLPVSEIPWEPEDKATLDAYEKKDAASKTCRSQLQEKETYRLWLRMKSREHEIEMSRLR